MKIILTLLFISGITFSVYSQGTSIGGIINQYSHVESIGIPDNVTLSNAAIFSPGDTVLLIQMKGAIMLGLDDNSYGTYQYSQGTPGAYEFLIIASINYPARNVVFTSNLIKNYDVYGLVQLIKVPSYKEATVTSELNTQPWDSVTTKTGGVLTMIVEGTLNLNANINVDGKGLIGGVPTPGDGVCTVTDPAVYDKYAYPETGTNSGYKGEGLVSRVLLVSTIPPVYPDFVKGKGSNFTGGGGGNGRFSGGGGGSGAGGISETILGSGGIGGVESDVVCGAGFQFGNGLGGKTLYNSISGGIYLGSGGGSATFGNASTATAGGTGGGIIIIICDTLKGNGKIISANGGTVAGLSNGNAGAGGGGGGGTIALYQLNLSTGVASSALTLSANGGKGGNANNRFGEGGGGGGGLILTNNLSFPANVSMTANGGTAGTRTGGSLHANPGLNGGSNTFTPLLNGFLFNTIHSSVSNNQVDSVCSSMMPPKIIGTKPIGGTGSYTYIWQKSYERTFAAPIVLTNDTNPKDYTPKAADAITPTDSVWFRRIVMDAGPPAITDISKPVKIIIHPGISNNRVGNPDTVCYNGNPPAIKQLLPDLVYPSTYVLYAWQDSSSTGTWGATISTTKEYDPPALTTSTWYRRNVISGSCIAISPSVAMTVLPVITNNSILSTPQDICYGTPFNNLTATTTATTPALAGGDNTYRFKWISKINSPNVWTTAPGTSNQSGYNPVELPQNIPSNEYEFRRIVYSGSNDVCFDTTGIIHLRDFPVITNNTINTVTTNLPVCSGSAPARITGLQPDNGNGVFTYTWQDSTNSSTLWQDIPGYVNITDPEYQPPVLTITTSYRRVAYSSACSDISNSVNIIVLPQIASNFISLAAGGAIDTTICNGQIPNRLTGTAVSGGNGIYSYQWQNSLAAAGPFTDITGATQVNYPDPVSLTATTYYKRQVTSGACLSLSPATITINVLPPISNNIITPAQPGVCQNTLPGPVTGGAVGGGSGSFLYTWEQSTDGGVNWVPAEGTNTSGNYQPPVLSNPIKYRRKVTSGLADCCSSTSPEADIIINPEPAGPVYAGADESIYSLGNNYNLNADPPVVNGETGLWTVVDPGNAVIVDPSDSKTEVRNLSSGVNIFVWTITNGLCTIDDSVSIEMLPVVIPEGFSPNGDQWNNKFIIEGLNLSDDQIAELTILNGAGTVVFTTTNRNGEEWVDWDGTNNKGVDLPEGTYYYLFKLTIHGSAAKSLSGFIELKRY